MHVAGAPLPAPPVPEPRNARCGAGPAPMALYWGVSAGQDASHGVKGQTRRSTRTERPVTGTASPARHTRDSFSTGIAVSSSVAHSSP